MRIPYLDMNIMLRAIVRDTVNVLIMYNSPQLPLDLCISHCVIYPSTAQALSATG